MKDIMVLKYIKLSSNNNFQDYITAKGVKKPKIPKDKALKLYELLENFDIKDALNYGY